MRGIEFLQKAKDYLLNRPLNSIKNLNILPPYGIKSRITMGAVPALSDLIVGSLSLCRHQQFVMKITGECQTCKKWETAKEQEIIIMKKDATIGWIVQSSSSLQNWQL